MSFSRTVGYGQFLVDPEFSCRAKRTGSLDVTDDGTGLVVHELDTALGDTTTGA